MATMNDLENLVLGRSTDEVTFDTCEDNQRALLALAKQTRHTFLVVSRDLEPRLFDTSEVLDAVKAIALGSRNSQIRLIVQDPTLVIKRGHRIIELARRLPSYIQLRVPAREHANYNAAFVVADRVATIYRGLADRYEGRVCFNDPRHGDELSRLFAEMWESATPPPDLRALTL